MPIAIIDSTTGETVEADIETAYAFMSAHRPTFKEA